MALVFEQDPVVMQGRNVEDILHSAERGGVPSYVEKEEWRILPG